jgi:hypothetical protein
MATTAEQGIESAILHPFTLYMVNPPVLNNYNLSHSKKGKKEVKKERLK